MRFFAGAKGYCAAALLALGLPPVAPAQAQMALNPEARDQRKVLPTLAAPGVNPDATKVRANEKRAKRTARKPRR